MSSVTTLPYVAPWQSGFERYSTQVYTPTIAGNDHLIMLVPVGQWWRIIYVNFQFNTDATATVRTVAFEVFVAGVNKLFVAAVGAIAASTATTVLFGPNLTAFVDTANAQNQAITTPIPDLLWPPGAEVEIGIGNAGAGDTFQQLQTFAVEVYTEEYTPAGASDSENATARLVPLML